MLLKLILLFTIVPIVELAILLRLSSYIGVGYTLLIVFFTGIMGAYLARSEGKGVIRRIKLEMAQGRMPGDELINGLCVIVGGALLLTPGIFTDVIGFSLVIPVTRAAIKSTVRSKMKRMIEEGTFMFYFRK
ncbi:phage effecting protein FxsA [Clostridium aceticum]|uniref:Phage effecting protein FxsA n=1 Tax=Clostridium aceticum TaxID=84022 RepID=A0A0D8IBX2_9CLOT|nr:FxsA family protein [Clostridium aceticum]AKL96669.1 phage effecting protein FxsA [Clostridium aceticum]KJF27447.1 FxsA cytoplasmic membrane protein [Clostridium aceticum]